MAVTRDKQKSQARRERIQGIGEAAKMLGVTRQHLWAVVRGQRQSKSLLQRYRELNPQFTPMNQAQYPQAQQLSPADQFFGLEFVHGVLAKLHMGAVVVELASGADRSLQFAEDIGNHLEIQQLGRFDSTKWFPIVRHFFLVKPGKLAGALEFIKAALKQRGLLDQVKIGYYDPEERIWRTVHPTVLSETEASCDETTEQ